MMWKLDRTPGRYENPTNVGPPRVDGIKDR